MNLLKIPERRVFHMLKTLLRINVIGLITAALFVLTYPDFQEGLAKGAAIILRLNIILFVVMLPIASMGMGRFCMFLSSMGVPKKFVIILLLTQRGIFILSDRMEAALRSVRLRAPRMRLKTKLKAFAGITASSVLQGADRSERMSLAIMCRGGFKGFDSQFIIKAKDNEHY